MVRIFAKRKDSGCIRKLYSIPLNGTSVVMSHMQDVGAC